MLLNENGDPYIGENYIEPFDARYRITSRVIRWLDGNLAIIVTFLDITEHKKVVRNICKLPFKSWWDLPIPQDFASSLRV